MAYHGYPAMSSTKTTDTAKSEAQSVTQRRRSRRKKVRNSKIIVNLQPVNTEVESKAGNILHVNNQANSVQTDSAPCKCPDCNIVKVDIGTMMNDPAEARDKVKAAREAKKLAKQQAKMKRDIKQSAVAQPVAEVAESSKGPDDVQNKNDGTQEPSKMVKNQENPKELHKDIKSNDEVDRAAVSVNTLQSLKEAEIEKEQINAERASSKAAKQVKNKDPGSGDVASAALTTATPQADPDMTVRDVIETLRDIKTVAQEIKDVTAQVQALNLDKKKPEKKTLTSDVTHTVDAKSKKVGIPGDTLMPKEIKAKTAEEGKSKAELRAERRAKQEAQRAAKEAALQAKVVAAKPKEQKTQPGNEAIKTVVKEKSPKLKAPNKLSAKQQGHKVCWFRHLYNEDDKARLNKIPINSNLHPAIIKLGVQLATRVVTGSNARCIALLDALKKMVRDYSLPAKTEFGRGLETHLAASLEFLWRQRQPTASQTNAVKFFRHHLTQLPNNVDEFDAKKTLQEEIDRYIREQIDMAGEAISITVRNKISHGDNILTYGRSSLIERILVEAQQAGVEFRAVVCGAGAGTSTGAGAREMVRRLAARGVSCVCIDITALSFIMRTIDKVLLSGSALLANGCVLGAAGTAAVALAARAFNTPVLVACETHKFAERVLTDAFLYNEIGDPDELIGNDENSPLKGWRSNPNLTPLNLTYDVTPPNLVTAVVTELAILPCTSAPVVLRFKLSEYSM